MAVLILFGNPIKDEIHGELFFYSNQRELVTNLKVKLPIRAELLIPEGVRRDLFAEKTREL